MTTKELDRASVMARLVDGTLTQVAAAQALGISVRQVRRLQRGYEARGARALVSDQEWTYDPEQLSTESERLRQASSQQT